MKFGISLSTYQTKFGAIVFSGDDIEKNTKTISSLGYDGVDLFVNKLDNQEIEYIYKLLQTYKLDVSLLASMWLSEKKSFLSDSDNERRKKAVERYESQIEVASKLGALSMPIGFSRGNLQDDEPEKKYYERLSESLKTLMDFAFQRNVKLLIEPINRYEMNTFNRVEQAIDFISKYRLDSVYLLIDTFHMNIEERSIEEAILLYGSMIKHIHITDSNRLAPGAGHLDYDSIIKAIKKIKYDGFLTIEACPLPSSYECARGGIEFLKSKTGNQFI